MTQPEPQPKPQPSGLAIFIDRASKVPVFEQICAAVRESARSGAMAAGASLPPTRAWAVELGVSRSTVVSAYEQLVAEGYLSSLPGSGYTLCPVGAVELPKPHPLSEPPAPELTTPERAPGAAPGPAPATRRQPQTRPRPRPFHAGVPDMRLFPHRQWARALARLCRSNPAGLLQGHGPFGNPELRQAVARHVSEWRGLQATPAQIIITAGATDALELCMRTLARPGETIALEDPGFLPMRAHATALGLRPQSLRNDDQGAVPGQNEARLVVLTPSHQFPLGGAMSPQRRQAFLHQAQARDSWIIEDDYDSEFRYAGRPIPAMAGFDGLLRSIYIGSFSKIFSNSLRLGYLIIPDSLCDQFQHSLERFGSNASVMAQQPLADFIASGEFYRHLRRMRRIYGERRRFLTARLAADFAAFGSFSDHQAGMQIAFHLYERFDDQQIASSAADLGLSTQALSAYCSDNRDINGLLLGFCAFSEVEMQPALDQLHGLLSAC